jgi:hypothetical protein
MTVQLRLPHVGAEREPAPSGRRLPSFLAVKTPEPIIHAERWHRDVLVALSLDGQIATIEAVEEAAPPRGTLYTIGVTDRSGTAFVLRVISEETERRGWQDVPGVAVVTRESLLRSPALEARRAVWAARDAPISASNRYRVAASLETAPDGLPLRDIIGIVEGRAREVIDTVCALACEDVLWLDLSRGLTPEAVVTGVRKPETEP